MKNFAENFRLSQICNSFSCHVQGGLKAVVWTDTIQFSVTVGGLLTILVLGVLSVGSIEEVWRISGEGGRLIFFK